MIGGSELAHQLAHKRKLGDVLFRKTVGVEVKIAVNYAAAVDIVLKHLYAVNYSLLSGNNLRLVGDVGYLKRRDRLQILLGVGGVLPLLQNLLLGFKLGTLILAPSGFFLSKTVGFELSSYLTGSLRGVHGNLAAVGIVNKNLADKLLKVALIHLFAQINKQVADLQLCYRVAAVEPC